MKTKARLFFIFLFGAALLILPVNSSAHTIAYDFQNMSKGSIGWVYLKMGFSHIIPFGFDHILFIVGVYLLKSDLKTVIWQATAFTAAHSITLGLAMYGYIHPAPSFIEPVIAGLDPKTMKPFICNMDLIG